VNREINPAEWDFCELSEPEVLACYHYEFARETPELVQKVAELRGATGRDRFEELIEFTHRFHCGSCQFFLWYPEWPQTPYLDVNERVRLRRIGILNRKPNDEELASKLRVLPAATYLDSSDTAWASLEETKVEIVIRPEFTHADLLNAFAALLRMDFPKQGKGSGRRLRPQGRSGGLAPKRQALKQLGIWRLLKEQTAAQTLRFLEKAKPSLPVPAESVLNRDRGKARAALANFRAHTLPGLNKGSYIDLLVSWMRDPDYQNRIVEALCKSQDVDRSIVLESIERVRATAKR
jgi:hypothetical protein